MVSCLYFYTIYEYLERHSSLQKQNLHCKSWVLSLTFLLPSLKTLFYKGYPLFLNTSLSLLEVFGKDLVQTFLEIQENYFRFINLALTPVVC